MPDLLDAVVLDFLTVVRGVGLAASVVEVALPHRLRRQTQLTGHAVDDFLDDQHALRTSEAAEGGIRSQVGLHHLPAQLDVRDVIAVVRVEHGAVGHRHGQIQRPPAVRVVRRLQGEQAALIVIANGELGEERMTFTRQHHVLIAVETHTRRASGHLRGQGGQRRRRGGLRLLAPEAAPHPRHGDHHLVRRDPQNVRHPVLHFGRMLGRTGHVDRPVLTGFGIGGLHLEIEMVLPTEGERPFQQMRGSGKRRIDIAAAHEIRFAVETLLRDALFDGQHRLQHFVAGDNLLRRGAALAGRFADHHGNNVSVELRHLRGQQLLILAHRADIIDPGNISRREHGMDARHFPRGGNIQLLYLGVGVRRMHRPDLEGSSTAQSDVIGVERLAGNMLGRAFVGKRTVGRNDRLGQR